MSPRKIKRRSAHRSTSWQASSRERLVATFERSEELIERGRPEEAIALLEPLEALHERVPDLHYFLGYAYAEAGRIYAAIPHYERARVLSGSGEYWQPLAGLYVEAALPAHALRALRRASQFRDVDPEFRAQLPKIMQATEQFLVNLADSLGLPLARAEKGFYDWEEGQIAIALNDFKACIAANRRAIQVLRDWPPPRNNLAQALFFTGEPQAAVEAEQRVLASAPDNIHALSNSIRFMAWTGREGEARGLWARLKEIVPGNGDLRLKMADAAAVLGEDESVRELLASLDMSEAGLDLQPGLLDKATFMLAVAEANLGLYDRALRRIKGMSRLPPGADRCLEALRSRQPGVGWAERYSYFHFSEFLPASEFDLFLDLMQQEDEMPAERFRDKASSFARRFPQIVLLAEQLIWVEMQPEAGVGLLQVIDTQEARAALRRFGLSQAGDDDARLLALSHLMEVGEIDPDESMRAWMGGQWRDVLARKYEIAERQVTYSDEVASLIEQARAAFEEEDYQEAEPLLRRILELEPQAKEVHNNLGALYARQGRHDEANASYRAALDIDPLYVFPRCNLVSYLLQEGDVGKAIEMLEPLANAERLTPQEVAFYSYTQACIALDQRDYGAAERALECALDVWPDYEPALDLLDWLEKVVPFRTGFFRDRWEEQHQRNLARRTRLQASLTVVDPTLAEALPLYPKDVLTSIARKVIPGGGWSALRKAELVERVIEVLLTPRVLGRVAEGLAERERVALQDVLHHEGAMPWVDFDACYGNDLEESPHWQYHEPESVMGNLRARGLLVESTVDGRLTVVIPADLRPLLREILSHA